MYRVQLELQAALDRQAALLRDARITLRPATDVGRPEPRRRALGRLVVRAGVAIGGEASSSLLATR